MKYPPTCLEKQTLLSKFIHNFYFATKYVIQILKITATNDRMIKNTSQIHIISKNKPKYAEKKETKSKSQNMEVIKSSSLSV